MSVVTKECPSCGAKVTMTPYDIGSGPEMSCSHCEWCWGAEGQDLKPLDIAAMRRMVDDLRNGRS